MKLIYIANIRIPNERAHSLQVMKMCEVFASLGHEVELIVPYLDKKTSPFAYYGVGETFFIRNIPSLGNPALGKKNYWLNSLSFAFFVNIYLLWIKLTTKKNIVIYTRGDSVLFLGLIAKFVWPIFWETHSKPNRLLRRYLSFANKACGVITVTDFYRRELEDVYKLKTKVLWAPDGVTFEEMNISMSKADARRELLLPVDKKIVLYTGSFYTYEYKGVDILLAAAVLLPSDYLLVLIGGTRPEIEKIERENNTTNIVLVPHISHIQVAKYLAVADVLVLPNKKGDETSEKYTSPMKLFEYMAARRPIVCSDLGSLKEILDESSAYIFKANDFKDLARVIIESLDDVSEADRRAERAFELSKQYTWLKRAENISNFINSQLFK